MEGGEELLDIVTPAMHDAIFTYTWNIQYFNKQVLPLHKDHSIGHCDFSGKILFKTVN